MILLGINCGLGNSDVASMPLRAVDLTSGWLDFPRPKTAIPRRCPLWPETVAAVKAAIATRPAPSDSAAAGLLFVTKYGRRWGSTTIGEPDAKGERKIANCDPVGQEFTKVLVSLKLKRPGLSFYALRHTFETVAGDSRDQVAVDAIMGHARDDMASVYRERIDDARLLDVVKHVHKWLWPAPAGDVAAAYDIAEGAQGG